MVSQEIVVGIDGSRASLCAVEWAVGRALKTGQSLRLICAFSTVAYTTYGFESAVTMIDTAALERGAQSAVDAARDHALSLPGADALSIEAETAPGDPASILVDRSASAAMIVIGTESHSRTFSRIFGTVSSTVPAYSKCPVVVVPLPPEGSQVRPVRKLVVGVEASEKVSQALRLAVDEAETWDAKLTVISAVPIPATTGIMTWIPNAVDHDNLMADMKRSLDAAVDSAIEGKDLTVKRHVMDGAPAQLLVEFSSAVDLIVVGSRGYSAFTQAVLGVTSQAVLSSAECPVMVVPHHNSVRKTVTYGWRN